MPTSLTFDEHVAVLQSSMRVLPDRGAAADAAAKATLTGTAAAVYLALWNRGDDVTLAGRPDRLDRWRATQRVHWS